MSSIDDVEPVQAAEPHHVTFFTPNRPVDGATVYVVAFWNEPVEPVDHDVLLPR